MKIAIMQPYIFPYIGYFQLLSAVDRFVCYDDVHFINRGWINRNNILKEGKAQLFTIPLNKASQNKRIHDITVVDKNQWYPAFTKTLQHAYKQAPHFESVQSLIDTVFHSSYNNIAELNHHCLKLISEYLNLNTEIIESSRKYNNQHLKGEERILDICLQEQANLYINPIGGLELYHENKFSAHHIELRFLKTESFHYSQYQETFTPHLSIIDVMMFNSVDKIQFFLQKHSLAKHNDETPS